MELKDAEMHWKRYKDGEKDPKAVWGKEVAREVEKRREEVRQWQQWVM